MTARLAVLATGFGLAVTGAALAHAAPVAVPPAPVPVTVAVASVSPSAVEVPYVRVPDCGDLPDGYGDATCVTWDEDAYWVYTNTDGTRVAECTHEDSGPVMPCVWDPANMGNGLPDGPVLYVLNFSE